MKNKILKVGIDLDGVIIDHASNKIRLARENGYFLKNSQVDSESMKKIIPPDIYSDIQKSIYGSEGLDSKPMKGAQRILKKIVKLFPEVCIISRRGIKMNEVRFGFQWLKNNNLQYIFNKKNVFFVATDEQKNMLCKKMGVDIYIDDKLKVLDNLFSVKNLILFDKGGSYKNLEKNITVVKNWDEFYGYLQKLNKMV